MCDKKYIELDKAIDALTAENLVDNMDSVFDSIPNRFHRAAQRVIAGIPTADVRPVVRGEWRLDDSGVPFCTNCGLVPEELSLFCWHCGADMRPKGTHDDKR